MQEQQSPCRGCIYCPDNSCEHEDVTVPLIKYYRQILKQAYEDAYIATGITFNVGEFDNCSCNSLKTLVRNLPAIHLQRAKENFSYDAHTPLFSISLSKLNTPIIISAPSIIKTPTSNSYFVHFYSILRLIQKVVTLFDANPNIDWHTPIHLLPPYRALPRDHNHII